MTKTKRQLRADAVERLRSIPNERMNAISVVVAIAGEAAYRLGGTRDARDMCIDLLTDDDSIIQEVESTIELLSDGADSREKLEEDVLKCYTHTVSTAMWPPSANKHTDMVSVSMDTVLEWLDRQDAITRRECDKPNWDYCETCELTAERDQLKDEHERIVKEMVDANTRQCERTNELIAERDELKRLYEAQANETACQSADLVAEQELNIKLEAERDIYREKLSRALDLAHEIGRLMP